MKISVKLIPNWRDVLRWAWSVRFILASVVCDVIGIGLAVAGAMGVQESPWQSITLQIVGALFNLAAFIARLTYQRDLSRECP